MSAPQTEPGTADSPTIPRDSCLWPAFIRWLYAEPAPGQVSNRTKVTGLLKRNLELVLTNPVPAPVPSIQTSPAGQVWTSPAPPSPTSRARSTSPTPSSPTSPARPTSRQYGRSARPARPDRPA